MSKKYTEEAMASALQEVKDGTLSLRAAAAKYSVPSSSLSDRKTGKVVHGSKWGGSTTLPAEKEKELVDHAIQRASMGIGFTKKNFLIFAGKYAAEQGYAFKVADASEKWWRGMKRRHPEFTLRTPEPTSAGRHLAMTRERMCKYFAVLKDVLEKNDLVNQPTRIWNMDETGLTLSSKPPKVIAKKGTKAVHNKSSASRELVTLIACGNANGDVIPPHVIVPGKTTRVLKGYDVENAPRGTNLSVTDSGWTKNGVGQLWFQNTFLPNIGTDRPQLLIMDGHESHHHVEFVKLARDNQIVLMELPSKTSNWTQPFDRTVFKSFKANWAEGIQDFIALTGVAVGHAQFFRILSRAWAASMTPVNVASGFSSTGIFPYCPGAIPNEAYDPSELYSTPDEGITRSDENNTGPPAKIVHVQVPRDLQSGAVTDLPLAIDKDGQLVVEETDGASTSSPAVDLVIEMGAETVTEPDQETTGECSDSQALTVVESALTADMARKYKKAYQEGKDLNDSLYVTWRMYKDRCYSSSGHTGKPLSTSTSTSSSTSTSTLLQLPLQEKNTQSKIKRKSVGQYFVISSDDAYNERVKDREEKEEKKRKQDERREIRLKKKEAKENISLKL